MDDRACPAIADRINRETAFSRLPLLSSLYKTFQEFKADRDSKDQSTCTYEKVLYRNMISQRAEKCHTQRQRAGGGDLHETEDPAVHIRFHFFLDGHIDGRVVTG